MTAAEVASYEWGVREDGGLDIWEDWHRQTGDTPPPFTEATARSETLSGYWSGAKLIRRTSGGEPEVIPCEPVVLGPPSNDDLACEIAGGVPVTFLGEDGEYAVALGHVHRHGMAQAVTLRLRDVHGDPDIAAVPADVVQHVHAIRIETPWEHTSDWTIVWRRPDRQPISSATPMAFPLTFVDVS